MSDSYKEILSRADLHFEEVRRLAGQPLQCRIRCPGCCHGLFEIGAADVAMIAEALRAASPRMRRLLVTRSREILELFDAPSIRDSDNAEKEAVAWDLEWEDVVGPEDRFTIPEAIVVASLFLD